MPTTQNAGAVTVGCARVGCEQLVLGSCCSQATIPCVVGDPVAPQLATVDSFSAVAFTAVSALCQALRELDPCSANVTIPCWANKFGIKYPDPCATSGWSTQVLAFLICLYVQLRFNVVNWDFLTALAARFGARFVWHWAGDFSGCDPALQFGWWTMARDSAPCPPPVACPPDPSLAHRPQLIPFGPACWEPPMSVNLVLYPDDVKIPANCNIPGGSHAITLPHDPELYQAFKWLLPQLLPQTMNVCLYEADPANCIS
jgi:hypothetical protein